MTLQLLKTPQFGQRKVTSDLRQHVLEFIRNGRLAPGSRLATEAELVRALRVSRSTVRRALEPLEREGWIDRRVGAGTFVGTRANELMPLDVRDGGNADPNKQPGEVEPALNQLKARRDRGIVRVAVLIYKIGDIVNDWYTPGILQGLDDAGHEQRVVVELLGDRDGSIDALSRRLELSHPDVLICLSNRLQHAFVIRDAQRLGIQCLVSGTPLAGLNVPGVSEDNKQAMSLAVGHLIEHGHRDIGIALPRLVEPWVFDRLDAYLQRISGAGLESHVHWTPAGDAVSTGEVESLQAFITGRRLTGFVPGNIDSMRGLDALVRNGRLSVPRDLSVVSFEQDHPDRNYLGVAQATRIAFPLREMGQRLAQLARFAVEGSVLEKAELLPALLIAGESVISIERFGV